MKREKCVLCQNSLIEMSRINDMSSFMGVVDENKDIIYNDMVFGYCSVCNLPQFINLLNLDIVYMLNHNTDIVGELWKEHYLQFCDFIKINSNGGVVLEIGDPSAKIAKSIKEFYNKWVIVEPNTDLESFENVEIVKQFFDGRNPTNYQVDMIVHSHVLEHMYNPIEFLTNCNQILPDGGVTIFSIPNIKWLLYNDSPPTSILHFEHTYYISEDNIEIFLNKCGFKLDKIVKYRNHSLFIKASKNKTELTDQNLNYNPFKNDRRRLMNLIEFYGDKVKNYNEILGDNEFYLYSAHINSQYVLNSGLSKNIKGILDKSKTKVGKKLYGYDYDVFSPEIIRDKNTIVLASHVGVYYEEIRDELLKINKNITIL